MITNEGLINEEAASTNISQWLWIIFANIDLSSNLRKIKLESECTKALIGHKISALEKRRSNEWVVSPIKNESKMLSVWDEI